MHLSAGVPLRDQDTGNKPYILVLGHHFQDTGNKSYTQCWGTSSRQRHPKQIIHLNVGASLRDQDTGNKSHILVLGHHFESKTLATDQDTGNISYIFVLGYHFETKTPATNRTSQCWGTTSRPRHRQQIVHLSAGAPLRDQDTGNKSFILVLGHHFETKTPATNRTF